MVSKHLQIWIFLLASQINDKSNDFIFHFPKFIHENPVDFTCFFFFFCFLGPYLWHMEVRRLGVESEL